MSVCIKPLYDAGILYVDYQIERIYNALESAGILDETILIITSDHGESLGERGDMGHGALLYESVLKIPLIMRNPATKEALKSLGYVQ